MSKNLKTLLLSIDQRGIATMTLNRPEVRNAFNEQLIADITKTITKLGDDKNIRAILLKGSGETFSAGGDLNWMKKAADYTEAENWSDAVKLSDMFDTLNNVAKPTICLIQGAAMGGATGLISCCDIAIATADAKFAFSEVKLGLIPATISPFVLKAIGARAARRYFLTGERFDGTAALNMGLVHKLVDNNEMLDLAGEQIITEILSGGVEAVAASKKLIADVSGKTIDSDLRHATAELIAMRRASAEGSEGLAAFLEKRKASWIDK
jgi:methylglutaconyl-CoA hydratase